MRSILSVKDLSVFFKHDSGTSKALDKLSFNLYAGQICGIVGESGSGKSVTSLSIMGLLSLSAKIEGEIIFDDGVNPPLDLLKLSGKEMNKFRGNKIAMIFQEPMTSLNPVLTCGYQVEEAIRLHHKINKAEARKKTIALFEEVQLPRPEKIFDSYPYEISGGQKQRVMIAMALSCDPELLIADEPTTALDVTVQKTIIELLKKIKVERNMSMIFISHDLGVISEIADQIIVMYKGEIKETGNVEDVFRNPQHPYTKGLLACKPNMDLELRRLPTVSDFIDKENPKDYFSFIESLKINPQQDILDKEDLYKQEPILRVKDLSKWYPVRNGLFGTAVDKVVAVDHVSLDVYPGEVLGLVGESGCGKTTLGRSILRLIEPDEGSIHFMGKDITSLNVSEMREMRAEMQIIFQDPYSSLNPRFTVGQTLTEPMMVHGIGKNKKERKDKAIDMLERVGLSVMHYERYPHEFSGGQRQRICIARALMLEPKLIICDESVSALDVSVQAQVLNLLSDLKDQLNLTYIFISHDLSVVKHFSDRMVVMNKGKIVEQGFPEDIYKNPKEEYTRKLINAIPGTN